MKKSTKCILLSLAFSLFLLISLILELPGENLSVCFFDVGQGDSALIQKGDYQILIDGGPDQSVLAEMGQVMPFYDRTIEEVVLTHPHNDHLRGLNEVVDRYKIKVVYLTQVSYSSKEYEIFLTKVNEKKITIRVMDKNEVAIPFEKASLEFLWPGSDFKDKPIDNLNNSSIVNRFCYIEQCFLFLGDLEADSQEEIVSYYQNRSGVFKSSILKFAHHGSANGAFEPLLKLASPSYIIFSVGEDNNFGHPSEESVNLAKKYGKTLRTDQKGTIIFQVDSLGKLSLVE